MVKAAERWKATYGNDGVLDEGLGADELVVGGVVDGVEDAGLLRHSLGRPGEGAGLDADGAELDVAAAGADEVNSSLLLVADKLGVGGRTAELVVALHLVDSATATGGAALVARVTSDTHVDLL